MSDKSIRKDFVDGVQEIFTTLFNDGVEDGVDFYALDLDNTSTNVYGECKYKQYKDPKKLVCKAEIKPFHGDNAIEYIKNSATFTVTLKSLQENDLDLTDYGLDLMRRGIMYFNGTFYYIDNITPKAYIEDVFLMYAFTCTQILDEEVNFQENYTNDSNDTLTVGDNKSVVKILLKG